MRSGGHDNRFSFSSIPTAPKFTLTRQSKRKRTFKRSNGRGKKKFFFLLLFRERTRGHVSPPPLNRNATIRPWRYKGGILFCPFHQVAVWWITDKKKTFFSFSLWRSRCVRHLLHPGNVCFRIKLNWLHHLIWRNGDRQSWQPRGHAGSSLAHTKRNIWTRRHLKRNKKNKLSSQYRNCHHCTVWGTTWHSLGNVCRIDEAANSARTNVFR